MQNTYGKVAKVLNPLRNVKIPTMSIDRLNPEANLQIGEMPKPRYIKEDWNTAADCDGSPIKWIGMEAYL